MTALSLPKTTRRAGRLARVGLAALTSLAALAAFAPATVRGAEEHHATKASAEAPAAGEHEEKAPDLIPKEVRAPEIITTLTTLVIFLGLVVILGKYAWGPIVSGLKAREDKIRKDIREAEEARLRAERTLKEYTAQLATAEQQVRDLIAKASADAQQLATGIRASAQQEAQEAKERATKDIEAAKNQALAEIYDQTATLATTVAEKILRRNLNADDQRDLVRSSLEQLKGVNAN